MFPFYTLTYQPAKIAHAQEVQIQVSSESGDKKSPCYVYQRRLLVLLPHTNSSKVKIHRVLKKRKKEIKNAMSCYAHNPIPRVISSLKSS